MIARIAQTKKANTGLWGVSGAFQPGSAEGVELGRNNKSSNIYAPMATSRD